MAKITFNGNVSTWDAKFLGKADERITAEYAREFSAAAKPIIDNIAAGAVILLNALGKKAFGAELTKFRAEIDHNWDLYSQIVAGDIRLVLSRTSGAETIPETAADFCEFCKFVRASGLLIPRPVANDKPDAEPKEIEL